LHYSFNVQHVVFAFGILASTESPAIADAPATSTDATELMHRVASAYAQTAHGVVGVRSQSLLTIKAPVFHRRIANEGWFVFVDGTLAMSSESRDPRQPPLRDPYRAEYARDYAFAYAPCPSCSPGTAAVAFSSPLHDVEHASGQLVIDLDTALIVSQTEKPYKLPWPTQDGQLVATWGRVGGGWFPETIAGAFVGRIGPFVGHATYAQSLSSYNYYPNVETAAVALRQGAAPVAVGR